MRDRAPSKDPLRKAHGASSRALLGRDALQDGSIDAPPHGDRGAASTALRLRALRATLKDTRAALDSIVSVQSPGTQGRSGRVQRSARHGGSHCAPTALSPGSPAPAGGAYFCREAEAAPSRAACRRPAAAAPGRGSPAGGHAARDCGAARAGLSLRAGGASASAASARCGLVSAESDSLAHSLSLTIEGGASAAAAAERFNLCSAESDSPGRSLSFTIEGVYEAAPWSAPQAGSRPAPAADRGAGLRAGSPPAAPAAWPAGRCALALEGQGGAASERSHGSATSSACPCSPVGDPLWQVPTPTRSAPSSPHCCPPAPDQRPPAEGVRPPAAARRPEAQGPPARPADGAAAAAAARAAPGQGREATAALGPGAAGGAEAAPRAAAILARLTEQLRRGGSRTPRAAQPLAPWAAVPRDSRSARGAARASGCRPSGEARREGGAWEAEARPAPPSAGAEAPRAPAEAGAAAARQPKPSCADVGVGGHEVGEVAGDAPRAAAAEGGGVAGAAGEPPEGEAPGGPEDVGSSQDSRGEAGLSLRERVALLEKCGASSGALKVGAPPGGPQEAPHAPAASLKDRVALLERLFLQRGSDPALCGAAGCGAASPGGAPSPRQPARAQGGGEAEGAAGGGPSTPAAPSGAARGPAPAAGCGLSPGDGGGSGSDRPSPDAKGRGKGQGKAKGPPMPAPPAPPRASSKAPHGASPPPRAASKGAGPKGGGKGPAPRRPDVEPGVAMKRLFWSSFILDGAALAERRSTVWGAIEDECVEGFDASELERLFCERHPTKARGAGASADGQSGPSPARPRLQVLEESRRRQVCIMLARLPPVEATVEAVTDMDDAALSRDQVELLLVAAPSQEELASLHGAAAQLSAGGAEEPPRWDDAEAFVLRLGAVPSFALRLQVWAFENAFDERCGALRAAADDIVQACAGLRSSRQVRRLLALSLEVGNYLNAGTPRGRADGFSVDCLAQMRTVKASLNFGSSVTLLDFMVFQLERARPGGLEELFAEGGEAQAARAAARHKLADLSSELQAFCLQAESLARRAREAPADAGGSALASRGLRVEARQGELVALKEGFARAERAYADLCLWLHEGGASGRQRRPPEDMFGAWSDFFQAVKASLESIYRRRARRRKATSAHVHRPLGKLKETLVAEGTVVPPDLEESLDISLSSVAPPVSTKALHGRASRSCPPGHRALSQTT